MAGVRQEIRLQTIDRYVRLKHGAPRSLTPQETDIISKYVRRMIDKIKRQTPVDTGTMQDHWTAYLDPTGGNMKITIENGIYYASYVHWSGESSLVYKYAIPEAWADVEKALTIETKRAIDATEEKIKISGLSLWEATRAALAGAL